MNRRVEPESEMTRPEVVGNAAQIALIRRWRHDMVAEYPVGAVDAMLARIDALHDALWEAVIGLSSPLGIWTCGLCLCNWRTEEEENHDDGCLLNMAAGPSTQNGGNHHDTPAKTGTN